MAQAGIRFPEIMIPAPGVNLQRWAVIACDQFTSDENYWNSVTRIVGDAPSALHIILPEIYLSGHSPQQEEKRIRGTMQQYLDEGVLMPIADSAVYVRRALRNGTIRRGLVVALDLDAYDYHPGTDAIVRASEETIPDRLPPRAAIRRDAPLESPHVLVLYDDPEDQLIGAAEADRPRLKRLYQTSLMEDGGSIEGYQIPINSSTTEGIAAAITRIARESKAASDFVFATGDGNHSLAAAKTVWEERKASGASENDPFRYCLVELVNVYDQGLPFHPIHRVVAAQPELVAEWLAECNGASGQSVTLVGPADRQTLTIRDDCGLAVAVVDQAIAELGVAVDYVHGEDEAIAAAEKIGGCAVLLPEFPRDQLYPVVSTRGALPRKAFSLGEARDKRYYLECRRLAVSPSSGSEEDSESSRSR